MKRNIVKEIENATDKSEPKTQSIKVSRKDILSTGSTLLNLALSDNPFGGFLKGKYFYLVGDSASGKTFLGMTCFAEVTKNKNFDGYRLIYDNVEDGMLMDVERLFGKEVAKRIEPPAKDKDGEPIYSSTVEEFYYNVDTAIKEEIPFIWFLDSMDGLSSEYEGEKFEAHKKAHEKGTASPGSYGDGKAKKNSEGIRQILKGIRDTNSILIILSQTRDNLGIGFEKKTRSGGHALRFYATCEIWSSITGDITKVIQGKKRSIGVNVLLKVKKNRITGKRKQVEIEIYPSYGIDDIGNCVDYLVDEGWWEKKKQTIIAKEFGVELTREKLIAIIEEEELENQLKSIVGKCWKEVELASELQRKPKY